MDRKTFLQVASLLPWGGSTLLDGSALLDGADRADEPVPRAAALKLSCNLYSFNEPLTSGAMTLEEVLKFCSDLGFAAVDPTGYYFPGYPRRPTAEYVNHIKQRAFLLGLDISGTGVRNDFITDDEKERRAEMRHVKRWVEAAAQLGAPVLRVFARRGIPEGHSREEATAWLVESLRECAAYGKRYGVMVALQNHAEFLKTAAQVEEVLQRADSDWLGLILDIGSLGGSDPYEEIATLAPYAVSWQIKEQVTVEGEKVKTDLDRVVGIVKESGYRGYLPIETLGPGAPRKQVPRFLAEVRRALASG